MRPGQSLHSQGRVRQDNKATSFTVNTINWTRTWASIMEQVYRHFFVFCRCFEGTCWGTEQLETSVPHPKQNWLGEKKYILFRNEELTGADFDPAGGGWGWGWGVSECEWASCGESILCHALCRPMVLTSSQCRKLLCATSSAAQWGWTRSAPLWKSQLDVFLLQLRRNRGPEQMQRVTSEVLHSFLKFNSVTSTEPSSGPSAVFYIWDANLVTWPPPSV